MSRADVIVSAVKGGRFLLWNQRLTIDRGQERVVRPATSYGRCPRDLT